MALMIKYRAQCYKCGQWFEKGQAYLHRIKGAWKCHCRKCCNGTTTDTDHVKPDGAQND